MFAKASQIQVIIPFRGYLRKIFLRFNDAFRNVLSSCGILCIIDGAIIFFGRRDANDL